LAPLTAAELTPLVDQGKLVFVELGAELDGEHRVYLSHSRRPRYSLPPTQETCVLDEGVEAEGLLGSSERAPHSAFHVCGSEQSDPKDEHIRFLENLEQVNEITGS
jgi:hypothetical protein